MMVGLLFFASCQELKEEPLAKDPESVEEKFDRLKFLSAVNKATNIYQEEARNSKKGKNFRSIYDSEHRIERYIGDIADGFNSDQLHYQSIPETSWNDPYEGHIFTNEATLDKSSLSPRVRMHLDNYENAVNSIAIQYEAESLTDDQAVAQIKTLSKNRGNIINSDQNISTEERKDMADLFYTMDEISDDIVHLLEDPAFEGQNLFLKKKFFRALARVLVVAVVTAAIIYTGVALVGAAKLKSAYLGHKAGIAALTKKTAIGASGKLYPGLTFGLGKGLIGATQNWDKEWGGLTKEAKYAVKVAW